MRRISALCSWGKCRILGRIHSLKPELEVRPYAHRADSSWRINKRHSCIACPGMFLAGAFGRNPLGRYGPSALASSAIARLCLLGNCSCIALLPSIHGHMSRSTTYIPVGVLHCSNTAHTWTYALLYLLHPTCMDALVSHETGCRERPWSRA
jgi:hypothetical protein